MCDSFNRQSFAHEIGDSWVYASDSVPAGSHSKLCATESIGGTRLAAGEGAEPLKGSALQLLLVMAGPNRGPALLAAAYRAVSLVIIGGLSTLPWRRVGVIGWAAFRHNTLARLLGIDQVRRCGYRWSGHVLS